MTLTQQLIVICGIVLQLSCGTHHSDGESATSPVLKSRKNPSASFTTETLGNRLALAGKPQTIEIDLSSRISEQSQTANSASLPVCLAPFKADDVVGELICLETEARKPIRAGNTRQVCNDGHHRFEPIEPLTVLIMADCERARVNIFRFSPAIRATLRD